MKRKMHAAIFFLIAVALVACGGAEAAGPEPAPAARTIVVEMNDIYFGDDADNLNNPPVWTVSSGDEVVAQLTNLGALEHNWTVLKAGEAIPVPFEESEHGDRVLFTSGNIAPGTETEFSFTAPAPGEYNVVCTVAGHAGLMQGRLVVTS